jgi:hypothetical protein
MWNEVNEYAMICKKNGQCAFYHLGCMHFNLPHNCPSSEPVQCKFINQRQCSMDAWRNLVDNIEASDTDYAVTFHWVPVSVDTIAPDINRFEHDEDPLQNRAKHGDFVERLRYAHGKFGAMVMNGCLHSYGVPLNMEQQAFNLRLDRFREIVAHNIDLFVERGLGNYSGPLVFQGCPRLTCNMAPSPLACGEQQKELREVDGMLKDVASGYNGQVQFLDANAVQALQPQSTAYPDDRHPCWIRPCSWDAGCQQAIAMEQKVMRDAYAVAYSAYEGHNEWYQEHSQQYQALRAIAERDRNVWVANQQKTYLEKQREWLQSQPSLRGAASALPSGQAYANLPQAPEPVQLEQEEASAQAAYSDLLGLKQWVSSEAQMVSQTLALQPQSYSNSEGACPALRQQWTELFNAHIGQHWERAEKYVTPPPEKRRKILTSPWGDLTPKRVQPAEPHVDHEVSLSLKHGASEPKAVEADLATAHSERHSLKLHSATGKDLKKPAKADTRLHHGAPESKAVEVDLVASHPEHHSLKLHAAKGKDLKKVATGRTASMTAATTTTTTRKSHTFATKARPELAIRAARWANPAHRQLQQAMPHLSKAAEEYVLWNS